MHHGVKFSAQSVRVLQQGENGWKKIKAEVGENGLRHKGLITMSQMCLQHLINLSVEQSALCTTNGICS